MYFDSDATEVLGVERLLRTVCECLIIRVLCNSSAATITRATALQWQSKRRS
ncbi:hypothetical protein [Burkholderia ubonensis]|uniref:hypothetical protein n=1 Tax=Burkholderia ubonensis TaxID=101571 RepID=UPI0012F90A69|nr:hypothetical protein [Burkholderia ubonensis]